jgi:hypothetical protein
MCKLFHLPTLPSSPHLSDVQFPGNPRPKSPPFLKSNIPFLPTDTHPSPLIPLPVPSPNLTEAGDGVHDHIYFEPRPWSRKQIVDYVNNSQCALDVPHHSIRVQGCYYGSVPSRCLWMIGPDGRVYLPTPFDLNYQTFDVRGWTLSLNDHYMDDQYQDWYSSNEQESFPWWSIFSHPPPKKPVLKPKYRVVDIESYDDILASDRSEAALLQACLKHNLIYLVELNMCRSHDGTPPLKLVDLWTPLCSYRHCMSPDLHECTRCAKHCHCEDKPRPPRRRRLTPRQIQEIMLFQQLYRNSQEPSCDGTPPTPDNSSDLPSVSASLQGLFDKVGSNAFAAAAANLPTNFTVNHVLEIPVIGDLVKWLSSMRDDVSWFTIIKESIFCVLHCRNGSWTLSSVLTALTHLFSNIGLPSNATQYFWEFFEKCKNLVLSSISSPIQAGGETLLECLPYALSGFMALICFFLIGKLPGGRETDQLIARASSFGRLIISYEKLDTYFRPMIETFVDFIRMKIYGISKRQLDGWGKIDEWVKEVNALRTTEFEARVRDDKTVIQQVNTLNDRGNEIVKQLDSLRIPAISRTRVTASMQFLAQARTIAAGSSAGGAKQRISPIVIHFYGDSGAGKSSMLGFLNTDLLKSLGCTDPSDLANKVYYRRALTENWDGFRNGTLGVVCDDFGSVKDSINNPNAQVYEAINMNNTAHFPLPMAHLSEKGQINMDCRYVVWTTNRSQFSFESLTNPEAIRNRVDLKFHMMVHPDYVKTKVINSQSLDTLNWEKVAQEVAAGDKFAALKAMQFVQVHPGSSNDKPMTIAGEIQRLSYQQMRDICVATLTKKVELGGQMLTTISDYWTAQYKDADVDMSAGPSARPKVTPMTEEAKTALYLEAINQVFNSGSSTAPVTVTEVPTDRSKISPEIVVFDDEPEAVRELWTVESETSKHDNFRRSTAFAYSSSEAEVANPGDMVILDGPSGASRLLSALKNFPAHIATFGSKPILSSTCHVDLWQTAANFLYAEPIPVGINVDPTTGKFIEKDMEALVAQYSDQHKLPMPPTADMHKLTTTNCFTVLCKDAFQLSREFSSFARYCFINSYSFHSVEAFVLYIRLFTVPHTPCYEHTRRGFASHLWERFLSPPVVRPASAQSNAFASALFSQFDIIIRNLCYLYAAFGAYYLVRWLWNRGTLDPVVKPVVKLGNDVSAAYSRYYFIPARDASFKFWWKLDPYTLKPIGKADHCDIEMYIPGPKPDHNVTMCKSSHDFQAPEVSRLFTRVAKCSPCDFHAQCEAYSSIPASVRAPAHESYSHLPASVKAPAHEAYSTAPASVKPPAHESKAESQTDANVQNIFTRVFANAYMLSSRSDKSQPWVSHGTATALEGRVFFTNQHIWALSSETICLSTANGQQHYIFNKSDVSVSLAKDLSSEHSAHDVCLFEAPRSVPLHATLRKHIIDAEGFSTHQTLPRVLLAGYGPAGIALARYSDLCVAQDRPTSLTLNGAPYSVIRQSYAYGVETEKGDCGSVLMAVDTRYAKKIIGIHAGGGPHGSKYTALATAVHSGLISQLVDNLTLKYPESMKCGEIECELPVNFEIQNDRILIPNLVPGFVCNGTISGRIFEKGETNIIPSPGHGMVQDPTTKPAHLKSFTNPSGLTVNPRKLAMKKACTANVSPPADILASAVNHYKQILFRQLDDSDQVPLTLPEAIQGRIGDPLYPGINRNAGCGYGWAQKGKGKTAYLGSEDWIVDHPEVIESIRKLDERLAEGRRLNFEFIDRLKDERRPIEKVDAGKTRLYSEAKMDATIFTRREMMGFCAHMLRHPLDFESCVGMNAFGSDWHALASSLLRNGKKTIAGDFTNYDGSLSAAILWAVCDIVCEFYHHKRDPQIIAIFHELINSIHISGNNVYMWTHSQPSGCAITTILNCVYHSIAFRCAFMIAMQNQAPQFANWDTFEKYIRHFNYGDDDVTSISDYIIEYINQHTLTEAYATFGMTYTDETKSGTPVAYRQLSEVKFLKRGFSFDRDQQRWRAPLCSETILEMTNWIHGRDADLLLSLELKSAIYEAAQHPKCVYEDFISRFQPLRHYLNDTAFPITFPLYSESQLLDAERYCGVYRDLSFNPCDQGCFSMSERKAAANPATVVPSAQGGALFSATGQCVPSSISEKDQLTRTKDALYRCMECLQISPAQSNSTPDTPAFAGPSETIERFQTTVFHEDGDVTSARPLSTTASSIIRNPTHDLLTNSISDILARPVRIKNFDWATAFPRGHELLDIQLPRAFLNIPMHHQKLSGFRYVKFDLVIEIQVNNQPFNAGGLILWFEPLKQQLDKSVPSAEQLPGITGYPKVLWKCGDETAARLHIPFIATISAYDLSFHYGGCGIVNLAVYSPLTGSLDVDGVVWIWAENITYDMPNGTFEIQSGEAETPVIEEVKATPGKLSKIASALSVVAAGAAAVTSISAPPLAPFIYAGSAILAAAGKIASLFGWSRPNDETTPVLYHASPFRHMACANGDSKAKPLSLDAQITTNIPTGVFGTIEDEMAINHLISKPTVCDVFQWKGVATQGKTIWKWPVCPTACPKAINTQIPNTEAVECHNSYLSYISNLAVFYRGGITYHFDIFKTPFHSGRFTIYWAPGADEGTDLALLNRDMLYKQVYDLRTVTEFSFTIPFVHTAPWKPLHGNENEAHHMYRAYNRPTGLLFCAVTNALRFPSTAADHIEIIVSVSAAPDFQFAFPELAPEAKLMLWGLHVSPPIYTNELQANFFPAPPSSGLQPNALAIGEAFVSFRQLLKRYQRHNPAPQPGTSFRPFRDLAPFSNIDPEEEIALPQYIRSWVASLYRFQSGSLKLLCPSGPTDRYTIATISPGFLPASQSAASPIVVSANAIEPITEFLVPFYQPWPAVPTELGYPRYSAEGPTNLQNSYSSIPYNEGTFFLSNIPPSETFQCIGEDFSYGFRVGPPVTYWKFPVPPTPVTVASTSG